MKIKILRMGLITLLASLLVVVLLVGKFGVNVKKPLLTATSCAGTCRVNCNDDETGQGKGTGGCSSELYNCVPNACSDVPDAGTSCVNAGFVCVPKGSCSAGHNQTGSCNTANTDCCDTVSSTTAPGATAGCVFDHYAKKQVCVQVNGSWQRCDTEPVGEMGVQTGCNSDAQCQAPFDNYVASLGYTNCIPGGFCANTSQKCTPNVLQYTNCHSDSSCFATNPPKSSTPTPTPTPTNTPTSTPTMTPTTTPTATPTSTPNSCNGTCGSNLNCQSGYFCYNGNCRNPSCQDESDCSCGSTTTPTPTTPPVLGASTPPNLPKTGSNLLGVIAGLLSTIGVGVFFFKKFKLI